MTHETPRPEHEREVRSPSNTFVHLPGTRRPTLTTLTQEPVTAALPPLDPMATIAPADEEFFHERYNPIYTIVPTKPVIVNQDNNYDRCVFTERPLCGPLLFANNTSDARDHCANERTFLSWLRLAVYMAIVSVAIVISFHLKAQPSDLERRLALPFGIIFWLLSIACLVSGLATYIQTVTRYSRRTALVQSGWKTQVVFTVVATAIIAACILFLSTNAKSSESSR